MNNNISDLIHSLDDVLAGGGRFGRFHEVPYVADNDFIGEILRERLDEIKDRLRNKNRNVLAGLRAFRLHLNSESENGQERQLNLFLKTQEHDFIVASPLSVATIPLMPITISRYRINGTDDYFLNPSPSTSLSHVEDIHLNEGDIYFDPDKRYTYYPRSSKPIRMITYTDLNTNIGYELAFDRTTLKLSGTVMTNTFDMKAITMLEILERAGSASAIEIAQNLLNHPSPILRWRALSTLNKQQHASVESVLETFCNDDAPFIANAARRALAAGRLNKVS